MKVDEADLVKRAGRGDDDAFETIVNHYSMRIVRYCHRMVGTGAEDLAQEIFVKIYRNLHQVKDSSGFRAWMFAIARNCCLDRLRRIKTRPQSQGDESIDEIQIGPGPTGEQRFDEKKRRELLYRAMEGLSEQAREILLLKEIQQLKISEIAKIL